MGNGWDRRFLERLPLAADRPLLAFGMTLLFVVVALGLRIAATPILPPGFPFVTFFPAVILSAFLFGLLPGAAAGLICGLLSLFFLLPPAPGSHGYRGVAVAMIFYGLVVATDLVLVHLMQRANTRLRSERERSAMLAENSELLFRELQHRVSNNLQVVAALLTLQKRHVTDAQARTALDEASRRLSLIGKIHRQLHDPSGSRIGIATFLDQLSCDLVDAAGRPGILCAVEADDSIAVAPDAAIPLALIVAESVSNALEHGFADRDTGQITIKLARADGKLIVDVCDDGCGLPEGFDLSRSDSLGLRIASTLARQLDGSFQLIGGRGAIARLTLPA